MIALDALCELMSFAGVACPSLADGGVCMDASFAKFILCEGNNIVTLVLSRDSFGTTLIGQIPDIFNNLTHLTYLELTPAVEAPGSLPSSVCSLRQLATLTLCVYVPLYGAVSYQCSFSSVPLCVLDVGIPPLDAVVTTAIASLGSTQKGTVL
jgi:hypothetical protein